MSERHQNIVVKPILGNESTTIVKVDATEETPSNSKSLRSASTESPCVDLALNRTITWNTSGPTTQRCVKITAPTLASTAGTTITTAATLDISGPPIAGTNVTITNPYALRVSGNIGVTGSGGISSVDYIDFLTTPVAADAYGRLHWDSGGESQGGLVYHLSDGTKVQIGMQSYQQCYNNTGSTITKGKAVKVTGASGQRLTIALAQGDSALNADALLGVVSNDIANNSLGYVTTYGVITGLNTNSFTEGDILYVDPVSAGAITNVKPSGTNHAVVVGFCVKKSAGDGHIVVKTEKDPAILDCTDVTLSGLTSGDVLSYDSATSQWKNYPNFSNSWCGDGSDGDVTISGNTTLTRSMYYNNLTINAGFTLNTAGYRVHVKGTLTVASTAVLQCTPTNGSNASGSSSGGGAAASTANETAARTAGGAGSNGVVGTASGGAAGSAVSLSCTNSTGGQGGSSGTSPAGGAASTITNIRYIRHIVSHFLTGAALVSSSGAAGGGSGGSGDGVNSGGGAGGGGGGAGILGVFARFIVNSGTICCRGGNGGNGANGTGGNANGGSGGGSGGGGLLMLIYSTLTNTGTIDAAAGTAGTGGNKAGTGVNGATGGTGTAGVVIKFNAQKGVFE